MLASETPTKIGGLVDYWLAVAAARDFRQVRWGLGISLVRF
jgi:hypothetical protein